MCSNVDVVEYPEEGFAILQDTRGSYLVFRDSDKIENLRDELELRVPKRYKPSKREMDVIQHEELEFA